MKTVNFSGELNEDFKTIFSTEGNSLYLQIGIFFNASNYLDWVWLKIVHSIRPGDHRN